MKKSPRKLSLCRETLNPLDGVAVLGAAPTAVRCPSADQQCTGPNSCECTFALNCTTRTTTLPPA